MAEESETELVQSAMDGNIGSFGKLCEKYYNAMAAVAYSVAGEHQLAEDAAQETFARALVNLKKLKSKEKFGCWLVSICRNVAKDMAKAKARIAGSEDVALLEREAKAEKSDNNESVRQAISRLSAAERELIVLRYYNNMSHGQISEVTGLSGPAINNRLSRARLKIAKYLKNNGFAEVEL